MHVKNCEVLEGNSTFSVEHLFAKDSNTHICPCTYILYEICCCCCLYFYKSLWRRSLSCPLQLNDILYIVLIYKKKEQNRKQRTWITSCFMNIIFQSCFLPPPSSSTTTATTSICICKIHISQENIIFTQNWKYNIYFKIYIDII